MSNKRGSTLAFTIVLIVVVSIISISIITSIYVQSRIKMNKLDESYEKIQLENEMYNVINLCIGKTEDQVEDTLKEYKKDILIITIDKLENHKLEFSIQLKGYKRIRKCVVEFSLDKDAVINKYSILKTGI